LWGQPRSSGRGTCVEHLSALLIIPKTLTPELEEQLTDHGDTLQGLANPKQLAEEAKANKVQITQAIAKEFIVKQKPQLSACPYNSSSRGPLELIP
jgi:hypothetical protein